MISKLPLKTILIVYGTLLLCTRLFYLRFFDFLGEKIIVFLAFTFLVLFVTLLVLTIIKAFKKDFKPLLIFVFMVLAVVYIPFEFVIGWTKFEFTRNYRKTVVNRLQTNYYDNILDEGKYPQYGTWVKSAHHRFKIFKSKSLEMVFIRQGKENDDITFYGELYLSDKSQLKSTTVYNFLGRQFEAKHLDGNWYWVECYEDVTPGP